MLRVLLATTVVLSPRVWFLVSFLEKRCHGLRLRVCEEEDEGRRERNVELFKHHYVCVFGFEGFIGTWGFGSFWCVSLIVPCELLSVFFKKLCWNNGIISVGDPF